MLVYFKVGNFGSIKEPVTINFEATGISEHQDTNVLENSKLRLLKTILLYGPNASGKSKILDAFVIYRMLILDSASYNSTRRIPVDPFLLNPNTIEQPTYFESEFVSNNKRYRYGYEATAANIQREWLLEIKSTTQSPIFLRIGQNFKVNHKKFINSDGLESKCNENALFLSVADQWNVQLAKNIYRWFFDMYTIHGLMDDSYKIYTDEMFHTKEYRGLINSLIQHADLGIKSLDVVEDTDEKKSRIKKKRGTSASEADEEKKSRVYTHHNVYDDSGTIIDEIYFSMEGHESEGTKKFYNILGAILDAVKNGHMVIIDEMDARLHTLLTKAIVRLFNGEIVKSGAQLLAACHDTAVMDGDLLRRDQIYMVEKDQFSATKVVNLSEYKNARKDTPFGKNYLEGKYGGIPFIENFENFLKNGEK